MSINKDGNLSVSYTKKIFIAGEGSLNYSNEFVVKRKKNEFAMQRKGDICFILFQHKDGVDKGKFYLIGKDVSNPTRNKFYWCGSFDTDTIQHAVDCNKSEIENNLNAFLRQFLENRIVSQVERSFHNFVFHNFVVDKYNAN